MFDNLDIEDKCKKELENAVNFSHLSHAVILEGSDESTRRAAAYELASALLCTGENKPCGKCPACIKTYAKSHPDMHFLEKGKDSATIKVDEIRQLKKKAALLPNDANKSVFIIYEAQNMGIAAQNAILKIFEEPASHINFILTCNTKSCFLDTVISRGTAYNLSKEKDTMQKSEEYAFGYEKANELLCAFAKKNEYTFLCLCADFIKNKELFSTSLDCMAVILRDAVVSSFKNDTSLSSNIDAVNLLKMNISTQKLLECIEAIQKLKDSFESSANYNLTVTRLTSVLYGIKQR